MAITDLALSSILLQLVGLELNIGILKGQLGSRDNKDKRINPFAFWAKV
jgi:hypothetical protein